MLRGLLSLLATLPLAATKGAGAWLDPKHYKGRASFAGMRFIAEDPPHVLNVVGTDDGIEWWHLKGACGGRDMTDITIDFAPKGGPGSVKGKWGRNLPVTSGGPVPPNDPDGHPIVAAHTIKFPDGNSWYLLETPLPAPAQPVRASRRYDDHVGAFTDPKHSKAAGASYAGWRFIAESPPHTLSVVGSDDGETWWFVSGSCADPRMSVITLDFTPKGNTLLVGEWRQAGRDPMARRQRVDACRDAGRARRRRQRPGRQAVARPAPAGTRRLCRARRSGSLARALLHDLPPPLREARDVDAAERRRRRAVARNLSLFLGIT